ncbi:hypothetical protein ABGB07_16695 [Micromonosporaceae bacterium B7E4]
MTGQIGADEALRRLSTTTYAQLRAVVQGPNGQVGLPTGGLTERNGD